MSAGNARLVGHDDEDGGRLRVLFASRLLRAKGLEAFVAAAGYFQGSGDVEFVVAGMIEPDDPDGYAIADLVGRPDLTFLGEVADMPNLLRRVDIICLPTMYGEGIPRILIEAAASGLPSIATDISGCREIVVDGVTGTLVKNQPTAAMALEIIAAVQRYLAEPELRRAQGTAALAHFQSGGFTQDAVIADFVNLLTATASGQPE